MLVVLALKLIDHGIAVLSFPVWCCRAKATVPIAAPSAYCITICARVRTEACTYRRLPA